MLGLVFIASLGALLFCICYLVANLLDENSLLLFFAYLGAFLLAGYIWSEFIVGFEPQTVDGILLKDTIFMWGVDAILVAIGTFPRIAKRFSR